MKRGWILVVVALAACGAGDDADVGADEGDVTTTQDTTTTTTTVSSAPDDIYGGLTTDDTTESGSTGTTDASTTTASTSTSTTSTTAATTSTTAGTTSTSAATTSTTAATTTSTTAGGSEVEIEIENFQFEGPATAPVGTTVRVRNRDGVSHTWTSTDGVFDSGTLSSGDRFEFVFDQPGTYAFVCQIHPGMQGSITIEG